MAGLTQPLELRRFIRITPRSGFDCLPFLDVLVVAGFVFLNVSAFVILPGVSVELPRGQTFSSMEGSFTGVLTIDRNEAFFFDGKKVSASGLEEQLRAFVEQSRSAAGAAPPITLLLKADASVSASFLMHLMELAQSAGFSKVHLATEVSPSAGPNEWNLPSGS